MADDKAIDKAIAIAFPIADAQRDLLRRIAPEITLPTLYRDGAENRPCVSCGMTLNVGPRVLASGLPLYCVICARYMVDSLGATHTVLNLSTDTNPH